MIPNSIVSVISSAIQSILHSRTDPHSRASSSCSCSTSAAAATQQSRATYWNGSSVVVVVAKCRRGATRRRRTTTSLLTANTQCFRPGSNFDIKFDRNLNDFRNRIPPSLSFAQQKDVCTCTLPIHLCDEILFILSVLWSLFSSWPRFGSVVD